MSDLFDWDASNVAHIALHDVTPGEAEEVILNNPLDLDHTVENGEVRVRQVGETARKRILAVVTTERGPLIRVVTAYPASAFLRSTYLKYRESWLYGETGRS
jgi:uncharacterized DUF497 family protein